MGFFSKVKRLFSSTISLPNDASDDLVSPYSLKRAKYKVNKKISVPMDYLAAFVINDRVCDLLEPGEYVLNFNSIPNTFRKNKMDKVPNNGRAKKFFYVDIYFVNMGKMTDMYWKSPSRFKLKTEQFGKIKGYFEGTATYRVLDTSGLLRIILMDYPFIRSHLAANVIADLIGQTVNDYIADATIPFTTMLTDNYTLSTTLKDYVAPRLEECGIEILSLSVTSINLKKKEQMLVNQYLSEYRRSNIEKQRMDITLPETPDKVENLDENIASQLSDYTASEVEKAPSFEEENKDTGADVILRRRGSAPNVSADNNVTMQKVDVEGAFSDMKENLRQCRYCDKMIGVEYKYCPYCGFKQE